MSSEHVEKLVLFSEFVGSALDPACAVLAEKLERAKGPYTRESAAALLPLLLEAGAYVLSSPARDALAPIYAARAEKVLTNLKLLGILDTKVDPALQRLFWENSDMLDRIDPLTGADVRSYNPGLRIHKLFDELARCPYILRHLDDEDTKDIERTLVAPAYFRDGVFQEMQKIHLLKGSAAIFPDERLAFHSGIIDALLQQYGPEIDDHTRFFNRGMPFAHKYIFAHMAIRDCATLYDLTNPHNVVIPETGPEYPRGTHDTVDFGCALGGHSYDEDSGWSLYVFRDIGMMSPAEILMVAHHETIHRWQDIQQHAPQAYAADSPFPAIMQEMLDGKEPLKSNREVADTVFGKEQGLRRYMMLDDEREAYIGTMRLGLGLLKRAPSYRVEAYYLRQIEQKLADCMAPECNRHAHADMAEEFMDSISRVLYRPRSRPAPVI